MKLRQKFFIFLVLIPSVSLISYLIISLRTFIQDKSNYIYETNQTVAAFIAKQITTISKYQSIDESTIKNVLKELTIPAEVFLTDNKGYVIFSSLASKNKITKLDQYFSKSSLEKLSEKTTLEGSFSDNNLNGQEIIVSFVKTTDSNLSTILLTPKTSAFRASLVIFGKAIFSLIGLLGIAILLSAWLSKTMSQGILNLKSSMEKFGSGNFDVTVKNNSQDEIGDLGRIFNKMIKQIQSLLIDRDDKLKFELEMNMASSIQKMLLPKGYFENQNIQFAGFYEAASHCGGDWWYYFTKEPYFVCCIGDVTGHGVHSALMTSASRAAFSLIEANYTSVSLAMTQLNTCLYDVMSGNLNMTCIIASINLETGELQYCNASHEAPIVMPAVERSLKKSDFNFLDEVHGPRLGEQKQYLYKEAKIELDTHQHILFYSDGLLDITNRENKKLGDKKALKVLGDNFNCKMSTNALKLNFENEVSIYRGQQSLDDDVSYFFLKWSSK